MRVRITFSKQGALRYTGHLDLHKLWERAARRAGLPLSYSQGFHPQPKISLAAALPLGFSSRGEVVDIRLNEEIPLQEISNRLKDNLPSGIQICKIESVDEGKPALQTQVLSALYGVRFTDPVDESDLSNRIDQFLKSTSIMRERRGKSYDLRPLVEMLSVIGDDYGKVMLQMKLAAREGATGRPDDVLSALEIKPESTQIERTGLIFSSNT